MYSKAALGAFLGVLLVVVPVLQGAADDPPPGSGKRSTVPVLYKPPRVGIPGGRLGGGTRAEGPCPTVKVAVLAPDHVGLTTQDQPTLYWYLATTTTAPIEFTVNEPQALRTLLKTQLPVPIQPGIQRVRLADYVIRLMPGRQYEWFVAVLCDAQEPSNNPHMGGIIEYIARPAALQAQLTHADQTQVPSLYAEAGLWYDTIAVLSEHIDTTPHDPVLRAQRAALLEQVGLLEVAAFDRR